MLTKKQEERRERAAAKAERLELAADAAFQRSSDVVAGIPMGQPILVGHHSEARHRRDIDRSIRAGRKGLELSKAARSAKWSAANAGRAITSDDPEAIQAIEARIAKLEEDSAAMKAANRVSRGTFQGYELRSVRAKIKRLRGRLADLVAESQRDAPDPIEGDGWALTECPDDKRVRFVFDSKPSADVRTLLKSEGFRWAPSVGAWQRLLNENGRRAAQRVRAMLESEAA